MATFKPIAVNRTGVTLTYKEGQYIVATQPFTDGVTTYQAGVYVDMLGARQQLTMQGPKGDKGDPGATGAPGQNGQAATITIGQVKTGAPGSAAQVSNSGTAQNAIVDFTIPTGEQGPRGTAGAGFFHTSAQSGVTVQISSLQPQLTPFVGDAVAFPNGDVRQITAVSGSTVTLGGVLFSYKGDAGINSALVQNVDGDSTENTFSQKFIKGDAQSKNYYNLGAYDTYVSNGDGTGTVTRRTQYNDDGTQSELAPKYQYTEKVIESQPIHIANQEECLYWHEEWRKGLNIAKVTFTGYAATYNSVYDFNASALKIGQTYTICVKTTNSGAQIYRNEKVFSGAFSITADGEEHIATLTCIGNTENILFKNSKDNTGLLGNNGDAFYDIAIYEGSHPYPYEDYNGKILHEKDLSGIQLFPTDVNPAETIGGDWEDLGTVTTSNSTTLHAYMRL